MLLLILGAGASFDSLPAILPRTGGALERFRPPLAAQLFENREHFANTLTRFIDARPVAPRLQTPSDGQSIEQVLEELRAEASEYPARHTQLAAVRFYLQTIIYETEQSWLSSNPAVLNLETLFDEIERKRKPEDDILIVTFNCKRSVVTW